VDIKAKHFNIVAVLWVTDIFKPPWWQGMASLAIIMQQSKNNLVGAYT
jgi:hypothetical protein